MAFGNIGTIWAEIGLDTKKLQTGVTVAKLKLSELDRTAMTKTASINAKLASIGKGLTSVGRNMSMYVTIPLLAMGAAATKAGMDFEDGMTKSLAIMKDISPQIRAEMELTAKDVVKYTTFSAKEAADAYFYLASAGLDAAQSIEALPRVARFAQAGNFDLALATDLLTDAQSALGLTIRDDVVKNMENMTRVSDVLVKANTLSNATVRQFSESLTNKAGPALRLLNKDLEEGVAVLAVYADQGIKGAEAGNYLNIILRDLQRSSINNAEAFEHFGVNVFDATGKVRNIADVITDLEGALDDLSDKEKRAALMMMGFQDRSISAMMALLGTSDAIRGYESDLRSATGFTEDVANKQMESFAASVKQLKNELVLVGIEIFDVLKPHLEGLIGDIKEGIKWWDNLTDSQKELVVSLGTFAAVVGPVLVGLGFMVRTVVALRTAVVALNIAAGGAGLTGTLLTLGATAGIIAQPLGALAMDAYFTQKHFEGLEGAQASLIAEGYEHIRLIESNIHALKNFSDEFPFAEKQMNQLAEAYVRGDITAEELNERLNNLRLGFIELHERGIGPAFIKTKEFYTAVKDTTDASKEFEGATEDTTEALEDQEETVDDLRQAYNELIDEIFGITNAENDLQEAEWDLIDSTKEIARIEKELEKAMSATGSTFIKNDEALHVYLSTNEEYVKLNARANELQGQLNKLLEEGKGNTTEYYSVQGDLNNVQARTNEIIKEGTGLTGESIKTDEQSAGQKERIAELTRELEEEINKYDDDLQKNLTTLGELYTEEGISIERKEELRQKLIDLLTQTQETTGLSQEAFIEMSAQFGLSGQEIIDMAVEVGIELDRAAETRILGIETEQAEKDIDAYVRFMSKIPKEVRTVVTTEYRTLGTAKSIAPAGGAMGGIVGYAGGGVIGGDSARQPMLSAAYGMVTPQRGRAIPIMAHENEVIANTGQQKNLAKWIMNKANTRPDGSGSGMIIENLNVITPKGTPADIANETEFMMRTIGMEYGLR